MHRHTAAQTVVVLEGRLQVNDSEIGPGAYCHFPPGQAMQHGPAGGEPCLFVTHFHGPFDVHPIGE
jgi:quercetin dioxygenase-like cupin family protein